MQGRTKIQHRTNVNTEPMSSGLPGSGEEKVRKGKEMCRTKDVQMHGKKGFRSWTTPFLHGNQYRAKSLKAHKGRLKKIRRNGEDELTLLSWRNKGSINCPALENQALPQKNGHVSKSLKA